MTSPVLNYTSLDYDSLLEDLIRFAESECGLNLTNLADNEPALLTAKFVAYLGDLISFAMNKLLLEAIPSRTIRFSNFAKHARSFGHTVRRRTAARGAVSFEVNWNNTTPPNGPVTISKSWKLTTSDGSGVIFQPVVDTVVSGVGTTTVQVDVIAGNEVSGESVGVSTGTIHQKFVLGNPNILLDTLAVTVNGVLWTRVDMIALEQATQVYEVTFDDDDVATIHFGDGHRGVVPTNGHTILATYKYGGGIASNVIPNAINAFETSTPSGFSISASSVTGGFDGPSLSEAKIDLIGFLTTIDRCISLADYSAQAGLTDGIIKTSASVGGIGGCCSPIKVAAISTGGGNLPASLIAAIQTRLSTRKEPNKKITVVDPTYVDLSIEVDLYVQPQYSGSQVKEHAVQLVSDQFDLASSNFGGSYVLQSLNELVSPSSISGLKYASVRKFTVLAHSGEYMRARTGNGTILIVQDSVNLRREWSITCLTTGTVSTFSVKERMIGTISELTAQSLTDYTANFGTNSLSTWSLLINPESNTNSVAITGNTDETITVSSTTDLRLLGEVGDPYVVERTTGVACKSYAQTVTSPVAGGTSTLNLNGNWAINDTVRMFDNQSPPSVHEFTITGGVPGAWTISSPTPASGFSGVITAEQMWSFNSLLKFVVRNGTIAWSVGDSLFVDTYATLDDVHLRDTDFPRLQASNLVLRTIGGV